MCHTPVFRCGKTVFLQITQTLFLGFRFLRPFQVIGKKAEGTPGRNGRIQLPQATRCCIPRIGKFRFPGLYPFFVQTQKRFPGHIHFAPDIQQLRHFFPCRNTQALGNAFYGTNICRYVFAHFPVTPGSSPYQPAVFIDEAAGQSVNFRFQHITDFGPGRKGIPNPLVKIPHFLRIIHIAQTQHRHHVLYLGKARRYVSAGAPRGRIRRNFIRVQCFNGTEPVGQCVIFRIADFRRVQHIVLVFMVPNLHAQPIRLPQQRFFCFAVFQYCRLILYRLFFFHKNILSTSVTAFLT